MSRITITIDDIIEAQNLTSGNEAFKDFDIVAVCPGNVEVFIYLCKHAEVISSSSSSLLLLSLPLLLSLLLGRYHLLRSQ